MNDYRPILRDILTVAPVVLAVSAWIGGVQLALQVGLASVFALGNFALLGLFASRLVHALARGEANVWFGLFSVVFKGAVGLGGVAALALWLPPAAIATGLFTVLLGIMLRGLILLMVPQADDALRGV